MSCRNSVTYYFYFVIIDVGCIIYRQLLSCHGEAEIRWERERVEGQGENELRRVLDRDQQLGGDGVSEILGIIFWGSFEDLHFGMDVEPKPDRAWAGRLN